MRILICDDDQNIIDQIHSLIIHFFKQSKTKLPVIQCYHSGDDLLSDTEDKDIVFLDIEMPGLNGIYVGNELKTQNKESIIFIVTSYSEYLDDAMRFHVFRYLSKPIDKQRFLKNFKEAVQLYNSANITIPIETKDGVYTCNAADIISLESCGHTIIVHTCREDFIAKHNMNYWSNVLNMPCFFQSHRSFIVNMKYVDAFDHSMIYLDGHRIRAYLTKRKYSEFKNAYLLYLESTR